MAEKTSTSLTLTLGHETLRVEAWGRGIRVRSVPMGEMPMNRDWALDLTPPECPAVVTDDSVEAGDIRCEIRGGRLRFFSGDRLLFEEQSYPWSLHETARTYTMRTGSPSFAASVRFEAQDGEVLHGMGQYRNARYNLKGCTLEMAHRNSQISVPFLLSNRGYGFLWNNPAVGSAVFAENVTEWRAEATECVDYWVTAADTPAEILANYTDVTGHASPLPESLMGLWQCKLRYRTQDELMAVAREYHRRGIPLDSIVIDFFHWDYQGDWCFDPEYWPDPAGMVKELKEMGIRLMVSVWPTIDPRSKNYHGFAANGYLLRTERGLPYTMNFQGETVFYDATNPGARKHAYNILRENYGQYGIDMFWLDEAEPEFTVNDYDHYRTYLGPYLEAGNIYPRMHSRMVYDGQVEDGVPDILNLVRCAWVGSPRYGALVWSGDIESSFREMKVQLANGLNMGVAGIPWWISDTGGFYGGNIEDPVFRELMVRWFQWAAFMPVLRMHGDRMPDAGPLVRGTDHGGGFSRSGAPNELWSYGEEAYGILLKYVGIRRGMKDYLKKTADEAVASGLPVMRPMYLEFPFDPVCWTLGDQYMFGADWLVAPVTDYGARERKVYLPAGRFTDTEGKTFDSRGEFVTVPVPLDTMPVFRRER
ncbi:MAG: family 31 glucosidase [Ruminococcaceae bacterium]|jgi:alpha-D-xyloside xylohydrolase|nr:family 31 glucosidase [Oscillospiraceae bacterium]